MRLILRSVIAGVAFLAPQSTAAQRPPQAPSPAALERAVDSLFRSRIRQDGPGCAVGAYRNGQVVLARGYGVASVEDRRPITPRTVFDLGSVSKPFTALAALMLEAEGRLPLDEDVRRWVPELPDYGTPIRVRDLLQHTSGLRDHGTLGAMSGGIVTTMRAFLDLMAAQAQLGFKPGTLHNYSHSDYLLLGIVIERVTGVPFAEHLRREVLAPLGMRGSAVGDGTALGAERAIGHDSTPGGIRLLFQTSRTFGGDNLHASVEDFAGWDRNLATPTVGGPAIMARMVGRPTLASGDTIPYAWGLRLGRHRGLRTIERGGHSDGVRSEFIRFPEQGFAVAVLCNAEHLEAGRLARGVADLYLADAMEPAVPRPRAPASVRIERRELERYVGTYRVRELPWMHLPIVLRNDTLHELLFDDVRDDTLIAMTPSGPGRFFEIGLTGNVGSFVFLPGKVGALPTLEISWNGGPVEVLERVPDAEPWRPAAPELADYAGAWISPELETLWRFEPRNGNLMLRRRGYADITLLPVARDEFMRSLGSWTDPLYLRFRFQRDRSGKVTGLTLSTPPIEGPVRDIRFVRTGLPP